MVAGYEISETLHEDRLTGVYRARKDGQPVVLKVLRAEYPTPRQLEAFRREHELLQRVETPDVVRALGIEPHGNGLVLVLEDVPGRPLSEHLAQQPIPLKDFLHLAPRLARAVGAIHDAQIIHKDIKPSNVLHAPAEDVLKIIDFGLANDLAVEEPEAETGRGMEGTLAYASPEQTGRMNRSLDHRTDFYSLGATFYEMLAGRPPFEADSPLALVHAHIARAPAPLESHVPMPPVVSEIVQKCLAKNAEDRYQSAAGLVHDLEECRRQLESTYTVSSFPLGQQDRPTRFRLPERLYGRESEVAAVLEGFDDVCRGATGVLLVSGLSGIGKSSLVQEVHKPLVRERGYFIEGKFDQYRRDRPYSALIQAFRGLAVQLLADPTPDRWKVAIEKALGPNLRLITDVVPELVHLVGEHPRPAEVGSKEAQNRFLLAFQDFIGVFQRREHPLVLFIDDLQWADDASLELLRVLATDTRSRYLYLMGCYRQKEVGPEHGLVRVLAEVREVAPVREIELGALGAQDVGRLLVDAFHVEPAATQDLSALVVEKTAGNPFFIRAFLRTLHEGGILVRSADTGEWTWDVAAIRGMEITDNVTELMAERLERLPAETQEALQVGACMGSRFASADLAAFLGVEPDHVHRQMRAAVHDGLVLVREDVQLVEERYRFVHDRVHQAAYSSLAEDARVERHHQIGTRLLARTEAPEESDDLFDIADQLNAGRSLLATDEARATLRALDLAASRQAKASAAFGPALRYAQIAMALLPAEPWQAAYDDALAIHVQQGELEFLAGDEAASEALLGAAIEHAATPLDAAQAFGVRIASLNARGRFADAIVVGRDALGRLGVELPEDEAAIGAQTGEAIGRIQAWLAENEIPSLADLPAMEDETLVCAMRLLVLLTSSAYIGNPAIYPLVVARQICLSIDHGNADVAPVAYSSYAVLTSPGGMEDVETSHAFGALALDMLDAELAAGNHININFVFGTFVHHWRGHVSGGLSYLQRAAHLALERGDFEYLVYASTFEAFYTILQWHDLDAVARALEDRADVLRRTRLEPVARSFWMARQVVLALQGEGDDPVALVGPGFDENASRAIWEQHGDFLSLSGLHIWKLFLCYLHGEIEEAMAWLERSQTYIVASTGMLLLAEHRFLSALVLAAHAADQEGDAAADAIERVRALHEDLVRWAGHCPEGFAHKAVLVEAELSALGGEAGFEATAALYERAADLAGEHGFVLHAALAHERAARHCARQGLQRFARGLFADAVYAYERVGARAKAEALRDAQGALVPETRPRRTGSTWDDETTTMEVDLESLVRSGQAIASEIQMDALLPELVRILVQAAGAVGGALLRPSGSDWQVVARLVEAGADVSLDRVRLDSADDVPAGIVQYVARSGERVVLDDAAAHGPFTEEATVKARGLRSVLCLPLQHQGHLRAIVYLENGLSAGAFTPSRIGLLGLLSSQIAIAIENADLYANLESEVRARTQELEEKNAFIRNAFGRYVSDDVAQSILQRPEGLELGGARQRVTVLMADLRGFTQVAEGLAPDRVVRLLNNHLSVMTDVILKHDGTIDEFIGDAILAIFGAPLGRPDDAERAVRCAVEMQRAMGTVNDRNRAQDLPVVAMGIGLSTGDVIAGNVGSERRAKYGVVGPTVNLAGRIESYTVGGQVLASKETIAAAGDAVRVGAHLEVRPKGVAEPITICDIAGIGSSPQGDVPRTSVSLVALDPALDVRLAILDGKDVRDEERAARIVRASPTEAELHGAGAIEPLANVRLAIEAAGGSFVYAKVLPSAASPDDALRVHLTAVPDDVRSLLGS